MITKTRMILRGALIIILLLVGASVAKASTFTAGPLVQLSGSSPFAGCTVGALPDSILYTNSEEEPWVDVNPTNPENRIAVWQQDRWSDGGAHGLVSAVTHNGGQTWSSTFAHFSLCSGGTSSNGGDFERASDPWVTFAPNGDAYQIALSFNASDAQSGVLVSKSADG